MEETTANCRFLARLRYDKLLKVPTDFMVKFKDDVLSPNGATWLKTKYQEKKWFVIIKKHVARGEYYFSSCWGWFVEDMELERNDLLIFTYMGEYTFMVDAFTGKGCGKGCSKESFSENFLIGGSNTIKLKRNILGLNVYVKEEVGGSSSIRGYNNVDIKKCEIKAMPTENLDEVSVGQSDAYFEKKLMHYDYYGLGLTKGFVENAHLAGKQNVALQFEGGCPVDVKLVERKSIKRVKHVLYDGWRQFHIEHNIMLGKTYSFEYIQSKEVINIKMVN